MAGQIGLENGDSNFRYHIESEIIELTGVIDRSPTLYYALTSQAVQATDGNLSATRIVSETADMSLSYRFDAVTAGGEQKMLIFYHHNRFGERVQLLELVSDIPKVFLPIVAR